MSPELTKTLSHASRKWGQTSLFLYFPLAALEQIIFLESSFHFFEANRFFFVTFRHNRQVMQVLHQLLLTLERKDDALFLAFGVCHVLFLDSTHCTPPFLSLYHDVRPVG